jgi:HK97 family phage prohead protease
VTTLLHKRATATTSTTTDRGEFTAIAAAYSVDRVGDRIVKGAFARTIEPWQRTGKQIPLHWTHSSKAEDIIGTVDPASMRETDEGLLVEGRLHLEDSSVAREAWRSVKADSIGVSFGYLTVKERKASDANELLEIDLYEISLTPSPANPDARVLSAKSLATIRVARFEV